MKLHDICQVYRYPTCFHIDRDIVHGAAFRIAERLAMPPEPQTAEDILHDLWDEARFKLSRSLKTEDLLEHIRSIGEYAVDELRAIVDDVERFNDDVRPAIRDAARELLAELPVRSAAAAAV